MPAHPAPRTDTWWAVVTDDTGRFDIAEIAPGTVVYRTRKEADRKAVLLRLERDYGGHAVLPSSPQPWADTPATVPPQPRPEPCGCRSCTSELARGQRPQHDQHEGMPF